MLEWGQPPSIESNTAISCLSKSIVQPIWSAVGYIKLLQFFPNHQAYLRNLSGPALASLGWDTSHLDDGGKLLLSKLVPMACGAGDPACLAHVKGLFGEWISNAST